GVRQDIGVPALRLLDDRAHLLLAELQVPDRVIGRGHTARGQDLDLGGSFAQLVARGTAAFGDAVGDAREIDAALATCAGDDRLGARPDVAVPAGLAQGTTRGKDARAPDEAVFGRLGKSAVGAAGIADRREAALQHAFEHLGRL